MTLRTVLLVAASVTLAALAFLAAAGSARGGAMVLSTLSPLPTDGSALARQSSQVLALAEAAAAKGEPSAELKPAIGQAADLALQGFLKEPMSVEAVRNAALLRARAGNSKNLRPLMVLAGQMSRRDTMTDLWLAQHHGNKGDIASMLSWLDYALRSSTSASELIIPALLNAARDPAVTAPLTNMLAKNPPWGDELWNAVAGAEDANANLARVRANLHRNGHRLDPRHDEKLMLLLASAGRYADVDALASALPRTVHAGAGVDGELVTDSSFTGEPALPPVGWQLFRDSNLDVYIDSSRGSLHIGAFGDTSGPVARQLVQLPASDLRLTAALQGNTGGPGKALFLSLECAQADNRTATQTIEFEGSRASARLRGGVNGCVYYWLNINVRRTSDGNAFEADLDSVSIRTVPRAQ